MSAASIPVSRIEHTHPSLPGHFPGMPVVPGVVLLNHVVAELTRQWPMLRVRGIPKLKFLRRLLPGQSFTVELSAPEADSLRFKCWRDHALLAEGRLSTSDAGGAAEQTANHSA